MKKHLRIASAVLSATLLAQNYVPLYANAAELKQVEFTHIATSKKDAKEISSIKLTGIEEPAIGKALSVVATAVADNGDTWKIPVVWIDEYGNVCNIAREGVKAYPVFAFYIPDGYKAKASNSKVHVTVPEYMDKIYEGQNLVIISDPQTGIQYITCANGAGSKITAEEGEKVDQYVRTNIQATQSQIDSEKAAKEVKHELTEQEIRLVQMHCDKKAIEKVGYEKLAVLAELVRYTIQPQAVNLLIDNFPSYTRAANNNELSKEIGLYIYYDDALMLHYDKETDAYTKPEYEDYKDAVAYASFRHDIDGYDTYTDEKTGITTKYGVYKGNIKNLIGVNVRGLEDSFVQGPDGIWRLEGEKRDELDNTIVHEMMHTFMRDYNRKGMTGALYDYEDGRAAFNYTNLHYPTWFVEGTATCVENAYTYWNGNYKTYYGYDSSKDEYGNIIGYTADKLVKSYDNPENLMQLKECDNDKNDKSAYSSGYLACLYLASLVTDNAEYREKYGIKGTAWYKYKDADGEDTYVINNKVLKQGLDIILSEMHGTMTDSNKWSSTPLDEIISKVTPVYEDGSPVYQSTQDFTDRFITADSMSADFCVDVLNYLELYSEGDKTANGSVLVDFTSTEKSLIEEKQVEGKAYVIQDNNTDCPANYIRSNVNPIVAYMSSGMGTPIKEKTEETDSQEQSDQTEVTEGQQQEGQADETQSSESSTGEIVEFTPASAQDDQPIAAKPVN